MVTLITPQNSFVRFNETAPPPHPVFGSVDYCLPVFDYTDVNFQFVLEGTEAEIDALCTPDGSGVTIGIRESCEDADLITFASKPTRYRLSLTQILFNWTHGLPGFDTVIDVNKCFVISVTVGAATYCSNCFERIADNDFTSVIEYGGDSDAFGFKYCMGGDIDTGGVPTGDCEPTLISFINVPTLSIPYTAQMLSMYGNLPTVQAWVNDGTGQLVNMGITIAFDSFPPNYINLDFGGPATGLVIIR